MATASAALISVKNRLGIKTADTSFDILINEMVLAAVARLYPRVSLEVDTQEVNPVVVDSYGECVIDISILSGGLRAAELVEAWDGYTWQRISDTRHHGTKLRLREVASGTTKVRIDGLKPYVAIADVNDWLLQSIYWYAMAEFYDYLAGSNSDYNIYMQNTGARAVDNMRDESLYYDQKADVYLNSQMRT